jgi:hypothetical protein
VLQSRNSHHWADEEIEPFIFPDLLEELDDIVIPFPSPLPVLMSRLLARDSYHVSQLLRTACL